MKRVLLADDHALVRGGIRLLLQNMPGVEVAGEAGDGRQAVEMAAVLRPDIVIMDVSMQNLNGIDAAAQIRRDLPAVQVIMLSMSADEHHVLQALRAGAAGYVLKDSAPDELQLAIDAVARGGTYLTPRVSRQVIDGYTRQPAETANPLDALTPRQREILQRIAEGQSTKQIAFALELSVKTVEAHRAQIMERVGIRDISGLTRFAIRTGLISPGR